MKILIKIKKYKKKEKPFILKKIHVMKNLIKKLAKEIQKS